MSGYFGVMLDMSRNAVMKPDEVKKFAKILKSMGYNMIQLYTEDTYEIPEEPYFGYLRGRYTQAELRDIVAYCDTIGVEVIPCIQTLAHLGAIFRWSPYKPIQDCNDIMLVDEERTYELIDNMFRSLQSVFTSKYVHIGCDEAHMLGLGKYLDQHGYRDRFGIIHKHLERVMEIAEKYGLHPMMWSDMFFRLATPNGAYRTEEDIITDKIVASCPKGVDLVYWDYYSDSRDMYDKMILSHKKFGNEIWFAGGAWCWTGWVPHNKWSLTSMELAMQACHEHGIRNIMMTMWGDNGKECSFYSVLPSLYAIRRFYDGVNDMDVIRKEFGEITGEDFDAMMRLDLPNDLREDRKYSADPSKFMLYNDPFLGIYDSVVAGGETALYRNYAEQLRVDAANSKQYGYIFACEAALCEVLAVKYDLGARSRTAYKVGNRDELARLADIYADALEKLEMFYRAFRDLWYRENKPHGFDVQELRLGGLMLRLRSCRERLLDYLDGKEASIPELEEIILDAQGRGKEYTPYVPCANSWSGTASVNPI